MRTGAVVAAGQRDVFDTHMVYHCKLRRHMRAVKVSYKLCHWLVKDNWSVRVICPAFSS